MAADARRGDAATRPDPDAVARLGARLLLDARLRAAAATFLGALHARGVAAAPIKGLVVSALLYDDPLDRPFGDVDVLVRRRDLRAVAALARDEGWPVVHDSKQLFTLNVVLPPGLPMDVRATIGPPLFSRLTAEDALARAEVVTDARVLGPPAGGAPAAGPGVPFRLLSGHDHLALLLLDAVFDKLALRSDLRKLDLTRALRRWTTSPARFAEHARAVGLAAIAWVGLTWLHDETGDPAAREVLNALEPLPPLPRAVAAPLRAAMRDHPYGPAARVGVRLLADHPARALAALALGAAGTARFYWRHGRRNPWEGALWKGPARED